MTSAQAQSSLPADVRNDLYSALLSGTGIRNIEATLTHEMQASGFLSTLRAYVTHLLRSGDCTSFNDVILRVKDKIRRDTDAARKESNGVNGMNGHVADDDDEYNLALPLRVSAEAGKTVKKEIEAVCDITVDE